MKSKDAEVIKITYLLNKALVTVLAPMGTMGRRVRRKGHNLQIMILLCVAILLVKSYVIA